MMKYFLTFVIAVFALQGTNAATLHKFQSRNALGDVVQDLSEELHKISQDLDDKLNKLSENFADKFNTIITEANFEEIVSELREEVTKLSADKTSCQETANKEIDLLEKLIKKQTFTCKYKVDVDFNSFKNKFEQLALEVQQLKKEIARDVFACMKESHGNFDKYGKCLKNKVDLIKEQMELVETSILATLDEVEKSSDFVMDKLSECISEAKKNVQVKAELIVKNLKTCVQGSEQTRSLNLPIFEVIAELTTKFESLLSEVTDRVVKMTITFEDKIEKILEGLRINEIITDLHSAVDTIVADDQSPDECGQVANDEVKQLENLIKTNVFTCKYESKTEFNGLVSKLEVLAQRVQGLISEIASDVFLCKKQSQGNFKKFGECLKQKINAIETDMENVEQVVMDTLDEVEKLSSVVFEKFEKCVNKYETTVVEQAQTIVDDLKTCVQVSHVFPTPRLSKFDAVQNYYKLVSNKINRIENDITTFDDKINIIVSNHNIEVLIVKIKEEIEDILDVSLQNTEDCRIETNEKINLLVSDSQAALQQCVSNVQLVANEIEEHYNVVVDKSVELNNQFTDVLLTCSQENLLNVPGYVKCLAQRSAALKDKVVELRKEVDETVNLILANSEEAIQSLEVCMDKVQDETAAKGQDIIEDTKKCVKNLELLD